jgi:hypothetical protein
MRRRSLSLWRYIESSVSVAKESGKPLYRRRLREGPSFTFFTFFTGVFLSRPTVRAVRERCM